jgi:hypothetical protein
MTWWAELLLLITGVLLWFTSAQRADDVWDMFQKLMAVLVVMVVLLGGRWVPLELAALLLAVCLPSASRFDQGDRS